MSCSIAFWQIHDPTQLNRQGPDVGDQYRSAIFTHGAEQQSATQSHRAIASSRSFARPIVTQILPAPRFWPAEEYHQRYFEKNGGAACHIIPGPSPMKRAEFAAAAAALATFGFARRVAVEPRAARPMK